MINQIYLNDTILKELKLQFKKSGIVKLESFLTAQNYALLKKDFAQSKKVHTKVPDKYSFSSLSNIKRFISWEFLSFLKETVGKNVATVEVRQFSHKDYTLLHDDLKMRKETKAYYFMCDAWKETYGGNLVFVNEKKDNFYVTPLGNSLVIIDKEKETKEFVQYVNHLSGKKSFTLLEFSFS